MANNTPKPTLNPDKYVVAYLSKEDAKVGGDTGKVTVQAWDTGNFEGMEELDSRTWEVGQVINVPCYLRVERRKGEKAKAAPRRNFAPIDDTEAEETQPM
jgi:hypothetical protein